MTIHSVDKMWSRDASDFEVVNGSAINVAIREAYQVVHDPDDTPLEIQAATGLPAANSLYPGTSFVLCSSANLTRVSPIMTIVGVAYAGISNENEPEITYSDTDVQHEFDEDWNGNPICTVLGERIEGVTASRPDPKLNVKRRFQTFNQYLTSAYRVSTNSDIFDGWPPGSARMTTFNANRIGSINSVNGYWEVTAEISFRIPYRTTAAKAWYSRVRHEGYYKRDPANPNGRPIRAFDGNKSPVSRPVLLDANGYEITNINNTLWREFQLYGSLPYNALGLL
jgi:hypothetical protein